MHVEESFPSALAIDEASPVSGLRRPCAMSVPNTEDGAFVTEAFYVMQVLKGKSSRGRGMEAKASIRICEFKICLSPTGISSLKLYPAVPYRAQN